MSSNVSRCLAHIVFVLCCVLIACVVLFQCIVLRKSVRSVSVSVYACNVCIGLCVIVVLHRVLLLPCQ